MRISTEQLTKEEFTRLVNTGVVVHSVHDSVYLDVSSTAKYFAIMRILPKRHQIRAQIKSAVFHTVYGRGS